MLINQKSTMQSKDLSIVEIKVHFIGNTKGLQHKLKH